MPAEQRSPEAGATLDRLLAGAHAELIRESASRELVERRSFAAALVDGEGRVVAATPLAPIANLELLARTCVERLPGLGAEDVLITNDPYSGGTRVQDHFAIAPFADGQGGRGHAIVSAAFPDVGGMTLGNDFAAAGDLWTEGVRTTPILIVRGGEVDADVIRLLEINTRLPLLVVADARLLARSAAALAAAAPAALASGLGAERIDETREAVAARAATSASAERRIDLEDGPELRLRVSSGDGALALDLDGSAAAQTDNNGNATAATASSALARAVGDAVGARSNSGLTEALTIAIPEGSCLDARFPLPVGAGRYQIGDALHEMALDALKEVLG